MRKRKWNQSREFPNPKIFLRNPVMPLLRCEGVSIRLRSCVLTQLYALPLTNIYFDTFLKNYCPENFEIFSVFRGHRCHQNIKILRESDEGIFMGEGGKKIFRPLISPLRGDMEPPNFCVRYVPLCALMADT